MWNTTKKGIPPSDIEREHLRILEDAVRDCMEDYDVRSAAVYQALDFLQKKSARSWGFTLFREGLENWNPTALQQGFRLICQHLGKSDKL